VRFPGQTETILIRTESPEQNISNNPGPGSEYPIGTKRRESWGSESVAWRGHSVKPCTPTRDLRGSEKRFWWFIRLSHETRDHQKGTERRSHRCLTSFWREAGRVRESRGHPRHAEPSRPSFIHPSTLSYPPQNLRHLPCPELGIVTTAEYREINRMAGRFQRVAQTPA